MNKPHRSTLAKRMLSIFTLLLLAGMLCLGMAAPALGAALQYSVLANYTQVEYGYVRGLPSKSINAVIQTSDGYLWIGSYTGLLRYAGTRFTEMTLENDDAIPNIMNFFEDSKGRLWIGTNGNGALVYENQTFTPVAKELSLSVTGFAEKKDGEILLSAKEGLFSVSTDGAFHAADEDCAIDNMLLDSQGRLWLIDLYGKLLPPPEATNLLAMIDPSYRYSCVYEDSRGGIWLGTESGSALLMESATDGSFRNVDMFHVKDSVVNAFCEDSDGNIWMLTDSGMGRFDKDRVFQPADGAKITNSLSSMIVDREGSLWIASSRNGLLQLIPSVIRDYNFAGNLGSHVTNSAITYQNQVFIATDDGLFVLDENDRAVQNELTAMLKDIRIRCLTEDSAGNLWLAAYSKYGAICYGADGSITIFDTQNGLSDNRARVITELRDGSIAVGTAEGLNILRNGQVVETYGVPQGLSNSIVLCMTESPSGTLYIGTDGGGIFTLADGAIHPADVGELDSPAILRLYLDPSDDSLWIATGKSFYHYDGTLRPLHHITKDVNAVFDIVPTPDGRICLLATDGIVCGTPGELLEDSPNLAVIINRGAMPFHITANSWNRIDSDGNLFLCGSSETGRFNVKFLTNNASATQLIIDKIIVDEMSLPTNEDTLSIPSDAKRLTIRAISPHFGFEENITFEYHLEGFDKEPLRVSANEEQEITYTNLRGGDHVFHIRTINGSGIYSPERRITIQKAYHWYEYPAVWVGIGAIFILLMVGLVRVLVSYRTRQLVKKKEEYKRITGQAILTISNAIDAKDSYTEGHSERVAEYSMEVARRLGMDEDSLEKLYYISLLHDIGKIGITDTILNKPERLTDDEFIIMKSHAEIGGEILKDFVALPNISDGAWAHHEKYDGSGYPRGLKGNEISLTARIIGVCDTYDAMATTRAYRAALDKSYIIGEIEKFSGTQFDPQIAQIVIEMIRDGFMDATEKKMKK